MTKRRIDFVARRLAAQMWGLPDKQRMCPSRFRGQ